jgi:predicted Zn-dependent protease
LAPLPAWLAQANYSRQAEREADAEALRVMQAAGIDPRHMVMFFEALKKAMPERDGNSNSAAFCLSSQPADADRMRFFNAVPKP